MTPSPMEPVRLSRLELRIVAMPMVTPFRTSFGSQQRLEKLLVRVEATSVDGTTAEGWGECAAPSAPIYSAEYTDGAAHVIEHHLGPRLLAVDALDAASVGPELAPMKGHPMAKAALEMAVLDAQLRCAGRSLAEHLGAVRERVPCGVSVGMPDVADPDAAVDALLEQVRGYLDDGYVRVKCKIEPGFDVTPMRAVRAELGDDLPLQVDANAAYAPDEHRPFEALDELGLLLIEQPFHPDRLLAHAALASRVVTPLCLDESIHDLAATIDALQLGACGIVNIKAGRVGGVVEAVRIHDACLDRDVPVWCGGMLETGLGRAVNVTLAALPGFRLPGDTSASDRYFAEDLTEPFVLEDGHLAVPSGPGIGRAPRPDVLAEVTTRVVDVG